MQLLEVASFGIGKVLIWVIVFLAAESIALGFYTLTVSGERNVLKETVKTKDTETQRQKDNVTFYKAWMERDKLDAVAKEAEFNRTMATKPKFVTQIKYVPTGDKCSDMSAIAEEARKNAEGEQL